MHWLAFDHMNGVTNQLQIAGKILKYLEMKQQVVNNQRVKRKFQGKLEKILN